MGRFARILGVASVLLALALVTVSAATPLDNPSFENGDLSGWDLTLPPGGEAAAVMAYTSIGGTLFTPTDGSWFALLKTNGPGSRTVLSQSFEVAGCGSIKGDAFFDAQDYFPFNDNAQVAIVDGAGVETVFYADVAGVGDYGETPWTPWEYTFPAPGSYAVEASVVNVLDSILDSRMGLDAVVLNLDEDCDGVLDEADMCPHTVIPEGVPTEELGVNRWALVDGDRVFDTTSPAGKGPQRYYTIYDTAGCSCEQIIAEMGLGEGHVKFGCSISAMDEWIAYVNP